MEKRSRPIPKKVRFNKEEWEFVNQRVADSPFDNFQNFARILLITGEIKMVDYSELQTLNSEVNRIGNNINQLAKLAHRFDEISSEDIRDLQKTITELTKTVQLKLSEELKQERTV